MDLSVQMSHLLLKANREEEHHTCSSSWHRKQMNQYIHVMEFAHFLKSTQKVLISSTNQRFYQYGSLSGEECRLYLLFIYLLYKP